MAREKHAKKLSDLDRARLEIVTLRQENIELRSELHKLEVQALQGEWQGRYARRGEHIQIHPDGSISRTVLEPSQ